MQLVKAKKITKLLFFNFLSYIMEKVDLVIVGAEGVVENGGIINKVGALVLHSSLLRHGAVGGTQEMEAVSCVTVRPSNPAWPQDFASASGCPPGPMSLQ